MHSRVVENFYTEVFNIQDLRDCLKITGDHEDYIIKNLLKGVIKYAENLMGFELSRKIICLSGRFSQNIKLKKPLILVRSVKSENKDINFMLNKGMLQPILSIGKELEITYEAGFTSFDIPDDIKSAILQHILSIYDFNINGGRIPYFSLEIYNSYRKINL